MTFDVALRYFHSTFTTFERLHEMYSFIEALFLQHGEKAPAPIVGLCHSAAFYVNRLVKSGFMEVGVDPVLVDGDNNILEGAADGNLCINRSWPGQMRTVYGDHQRFIETYFTTFPGRYFSGDGARRDEDGYFWITGRVDDVLNVSGHRMGTAEIESALVAHPQVAESAVVGYPHDIKGQGIYAYVTLVEGVEATDALVAELRQWTRKEIGPIATPDLLQWAPQLPKTRSGKIMRRILRKIAANDYADLGDTSTLTDPSVVSDLVDNRQNR